MLHVYRAQYLDQYQIEIVFSDGTKGVVDLEQYLKGPMFEPLKKKSYFKQFKVDSEN